MPALSYHSSSNMGESTIVPGSRNSSSDSGSDSDSLTTERVTQDPDRTHDRVRSRRIGSLCLRIPAKLKGEHFILI